MFYFQEKWFFVFISFYFLIFCFWVFFYLVKKPVLKKQYFALFFLLTSFFLLSLTFLEPRISSWEQKEKESASFLFLLDVSKSMEVVDMDFWGRRISRLDFSKNIIKNFILKHPDDRFWLVVFAWETLSLLPFTDNDDLFFTVLSWANYKNLSKQGSDFSLALLNIWNYFDWENIWAGLVVLSDGGEEREDIEIQDKNKIPSLFIGVWTKQGGYIPDGVNMFWEINYKYYKGQIVVSKLEEENIKYLAKQMGGKYLNAEKDFLLIESSLQEIAKKSKIVSWEWTKEAEMYFIFLAFVFFCLYLVFLFSKENIWKKII